jgi:hypothetical protein
MIDFEITMCATLRPDLIKRTLDSHIENLFKEDIQSAKLILNLDMAGAEGEEVKRDLVIDVLRVIESYPFRDYYYRIGTDPHFPTAFFWCWDRTRDQLVFNLEEDWLLKEKIDFKAMVKEMLDDESIVHLRLSQFSSTIETCKNWNKFTHWNGRWFEVLPEDKGVIGWCGHPSLNRRSFMAAALTYANRRKNPEKQIKGRRYSHPINDLFRESRFGVFTPQNSPAAVVDIGREWMVQNGYVKEGNKAFFTKWRKVGKR